MKKVFVLASLAVAGLGLHAQDTRKVVEPKFPQACAVLKAQLTKVGGTDGIAFADEAKPDTARLQQGIDSCGEGKALKLVADGPHNAFLMGPIDLKPGVTLLVDKGVTVYGSRVPKEFDLTPGSCGVVNDINKPGCKALISGTDAPNAGLMGDGVIEARGGAKIIIDGKVQDRSWWDMAAASKTAGFKHNSRLVNLVHCDNFTVYRITLRNSTSSHFAYANSNGLTVWGLKLDTPQNAINTDGIVPYASKNITVTQSYIRVGDDNIAIKADSEGPVTNMTVIHNHFYWGHGMSIGSGTLPEVSAIRVTDLSLDGTQLAAIRIKSGISNGGLVHDVVYDDICIRDSQRPIQLDTGYADNPGPAKNHPPVFQDITLHNVRISGGGKIQLNGYDETHRIGIQFDGVMLMDGPQAYQFTAKHADITLGPGPVNFKLAGVDSTVHGKAGSGNLSSCAAKFVPFPQD